MLAGAKLCVKRPGERQAKTIEIPPESVTFLHGRLVHSGCGYTEENTRVHYYVGGFKLQAMLRKNKDFLDTSDFYYGGDTSLNWAKQADNGKTSTAEERAGEGAEECIEEVLKTGNRGES